MRSEKEKQITGIFDLPLKGKISCATMGKINVEVNAVSKPNYESMTERELLAELLKEQKKGAMSEKAAAIAGVLLCLLLLIAVAALVPRVLGVLRQADQTLSQVQLTVDQAQQSLRKIDTLVQNTDTIVVENTDAVAEAMQKLNQVDLDSLNSSISSLSTILEPLASFLGRFR